MRLNSLDLMLTSPCRSKGENLTIHYGKHNLPDGEIYTGPVENSVNGWVKFTYPAIYQGQAVEGVELMFEQGRVVSAKAQVGEQLLLAMINSDEGSHYLGEFAIGTNYRDQLASHAISFSMKNSVEHFISPWERGTQRLVVGIRAQSIGI